MNVEDFYGSRFVPQPSSLTVYRDGKSGHGTETTKKYGEILLSNITYEVYKFITLLINLSLDLSLTKNSSVDYLDTVLIPPVLNQNWINKW